MKNDRGMNHHAPIHVWRTVVQFTRPLFFERIVDYDDEINV